MNNVIPPHIHDTMMACSRKLFNAAQSGDYDFACAVLKNTSDTLSFALTILQGKETSESN